MCATSATVAAKLKIVTLKLARWHVSTQGTLTREQVSAQGTLEHEHVSTQARWHVSTFLARRARNLADSSDSSFFSFGSQRQSF